MEASHGKGPSLMSLWPVLSSLRTSTIVTLMDIKCMMPVSDAGVHLRQSSSQGKPQADLVCDEGSGWIMDWWTGGAKNTHLPLFKGLPVCKGVIHLDKIK